MPELAAKSYASSERATSSASKCDSPVHADFVAQPLLRMQQVFGNQAVQRLLRAHVIQTRLTVNQPGDEYEREADAAADQVMRMPAPTTLQRQRTAWREEETLCRRCTECDEGEKLHRQELGPGPDSVPPLVDEVLGSPGRPLDREARAFFEPRFDYDFARVRIHTDAQAATSARSANAHAYTVGHHIVFGEGQYSPQTSAGQHLLAHELTHTVQQASATGTIPITRVPAVQAVTKAVSRLARKVADENIQSLSDDELASESQNVQQFLLKARAGDEAYAEQTAYLTQLEAEIRRRTPARQRAEANRQQLVGFVGKGVLESSPFATIPYVNAAELAFFEQFGEGVSDSIDEQPVARKQRILERFANLYFFPGHWGDKLAYAGGLFKGIVLGIWGEIKGILELLWLLPQIPYKLFNWINGLQSRLINVVTSGKASRLMDEIQELSKTAAEEIKEFFQDPGAGLQKLSRIFESFLSQGLTEAYKLGQKSVESAFRWLETSFWQLGEEIGKIIGWTLFQVLLLVGTEGIGNLIQKGLSAASKLIVTALREAGEFLSGLGSFFADAVNLIRKLAKTVLTALEKTLTALARALEKAKAFVEELFGAAKEEEAAAAAAKGGKPPASLVEKEVAATAREALQPSAEAVKQAERAVTDIVMKKYGHLGVRDISDLSKGAYTPGVDRLFIVGEGEGAVLLEVDAKLSIQAAPVRISEVSAFETAAKTGGASRLELLDRALAEGNITDLEYQSLKDSVQSGLVLEEVHGFGSVSGVSSGLSKAQVGYEQGEQFAHISEQLAKQQSRRLSAQIKATLVKSPADRRTTKSLINELWNDFEEVFGK